MFKLRKFTILRIRKKAFSIDDAFAIPKGLLHSFTIRDVGF